MTGRGILDPEQMQRIRSDPRSRYTIGPLSPTTFEMRISRCDTGPRLARSGWMSLARNGSLCRCLEQSRPRGEISSIPCM